MESFRGVDVLRLGSGDRLATQGEFLASVADEMQKSDSPPDVIVVLLASNSDTPLIRKMRNCGIPVILVSVVAQGGEDKRFFLRKMISRFRQRKFFNSFNKVVSSNVALQEDLADQGLAPSRNTVIPNGVNLKRFLSGKSRSKTGTEKRIGYPATSASVDVCWASS